MAALKGPKGAAARTMAMARWSSARWPDGRTISASTTRPLAVDGDVHRQLAIQLAPAVLGEVARAALLDLAAQRVVVDRVHLLARGRADVALLRARVLVVDALFDLGQQPQQLAAALVLLAHRCGSPSSRFGSGGGSAATSRRICASNCCCSSCSCSIWRRASSGASPTSICVVGGSGEVARPLSASPPPASEAWAMACALRRLLGGARVDQDHLQRRVLEHAVEALGVDEAHRQHRGVQRPATPAAPSAGWSGRAIPSRVPQFSPRPPAARRPRP